MSEKRKVPRLQAMTAETASVLMVTELVRDALRGNTTDLYESAEGTLATGSDRYVALVISNLAEIVAQFLQELPREIADEFLERLLLNAQFNQLTEGL